MTDPFLAEIERQAAAATEEWRQQRIDEIDTEHEVPQRIYNPVVGTDPETGGIVVEVELPDNPTANQMVEAMQEAAREAGLL